MPGLDRVQALLGLLVATAASSASGCTTVLDMDRDPPIVEGGPDFATSPQLRGSEGLDFVPAEVIVVHDAGVAGAGFRILATDRLGLCDRIKSVIAIEPGEKILSISIQVASPAVGHYQLGGEARPLGTATYVRADPTCAGLLEPVRGIGELDIVSTSDGVAGIADVTFSVGRARGRFTAKTCDVVSSRVLNCGPG